MKHIHDYAREACNAAFLRLLRRRKVPAWRRWVVSLFIALSPNRQEVEDEI